MLEIGGIRHEEGQDLSLRFELHLGLTCRLDLRLGTCGQWSFVYSFFFCNFWTSLSDPVSTFAFLGYLSENMNDKTNFFFPLSSMGKTFIVKKCQFTLFKS